MNFSKISFGKSRDFPGNPDPDPDPENHSGSGFRESLEEYKEEARKEKCCV